MRTTLVGLALLVVVPSLDAGPAPDPGRLPKQKLEALKKKLLDIVEAWAKERWNTGTSVHVRVVRLLGPSQAKVVLLSRSEDAKSGRQPDQDEVFTIFLDYYGDAWSATRLEGSCPATNHFNSWAVRFLMLAIDEAAEKP